MLVGLPTFGQDAAAAPPAAPSQELVELRRLKEEFELHRMAEEIQSIRSARIWSAIGGLVGIGGLLVACISLRRKCP